MAVAVRRFPRRCWPAVVTTLFGISRRLGASCSLLLADVWDEEPIRSCILKIRTRISVDPLLEGVWMSHSYSQLFVSSSTHVRHQQSSLDLPSPCALLRVRRFAWTHLVRRGCGVRPWGRAESWRVDASGKGATPPRGWATLAMAGELSSDAFRRVRARRHRRSRAPATAPRRAGRGPDRPGGASSPRAATRR